MKKKTIFIIIGAVLLFVIIAGSIPSGSSKSSTTTKKTEYTLSQFNSLKNGSSYTQVAEQMGGEGTLVTESVFDGVTYADYSWDNPDGSSIMVSFVGDALESKIQAGLK